MMSRMPMLIVAGIVALVTSAIAQNATPSVSATEFDVASIKPNNSSNLPPLNPVVLMVLRNGAIFTRNGRYSMQGINATTPSVLIQAAYDVRDFQILEAPDWVERERYDVEARAPEDTTFEQMRPMLRSLLADRFKLTLRRETRQLPVYELVPARDGLKIVPTREGSCVPREKAVLFGPLMCGGMRRQAANPALERKDVIEAAGVPMSTLIDFLSTESGRIVIDKSGFTDVFNFRLEFASTLPGGFTADAPAPSAPLGVSIFTAIEEQLGLRLRSTTGPVDVLVIDHVERPSPN
jgi:uncharacterized protein (TIGR03435 family)